MPAPSSPPAGIPNNNPVIVYNGKNLWIPRKFVGKPEISNTDAPNITKGDTYVQRVSNPSRQECKFTTDNFLNESKVWVEGEAAQLFTAAWDTFMAWAKAGKVFTFYRSATDATAGRSHFQYCVWTSKNDGLSLTTGNPRWSIEIEFATEGAAR